MQPETEEEHPPEMLNLFTESEWAVIQSLSPLPDKPPPSPTNRVADNRDAAQLGQMFFFDAHGFQRKTQFPAQHVIPPSTDSPMLKPLH